MPFIYGIPETVASLTRQSPIHYRLNPGDWGIRVGTHQQAIKLINAGIALAPPQPVEFLTAGVMSPCPVFSEEPMKISWEQSAMASPKNPFTGSKPIVEVTLGLAWSPLIGLCHVSSLGEILVKPCSSSLKLTENPIRRDIRQFDSLATLKWSDASARKIFPKSLLGLAVQRRLLRVPELFFSRPFFPVFVPALSLSSDPAPSTS